jgi:hypothetical protein
MHCVDRIQERFIREIEQVYLPKLQAFEQEARKNIVEGRILIDEGHSRRDLTANIEAGESTIQACKHFANVLRERRDTIFDENKQTKKVLAVAAHTYKTIRLSIDVAEVIAECRDAFKSLRQLRVPPLRPFQNLQLRRELQVLTEQMAEAK